MKHTDGNFNGARDASVYWQCWQPDTAPGALLLIAHGAGEHSARYEELASFFTDQGYVVAALDHPGHGNSAGTYGHIERLEDLVETLEIFRCRLRAEYPKLPFFLIGHSMGGLVSCLYLLRQQQDFVGCVLSGPAIKSEIKPPFLQLLLIRFLSMVAPKTRVLQLEASGVSRDPAVVEAYINDPLVNHDKMTARMVAELFGGMHRIQAEAKKITLPLLLLHGAEDVMASPEGSRFLYENAGSQDKHIEIFPGVYHEIFNEPEREAIFTDVVEWCDSRLDMHS